MPVRSLLGTVVLFALLSPLALAAEPAEIVQKFDAEIAPLLAGRCIDCHNAEAKKGGLDLSKVATAMAGGESGAAIVAGKPDESLLWQRIVAGDMPPKKPLPAAEREKLKAWLAAGARWGTSPIDPFRYSSDARAGYDWWALKPVQRPAVPAGKWPGVEGATSPIDAFVLAKLSEKQLQPAAPADKATLIRRVTFDLIGLPPTPAEVAAFVADTAPDAYEKLVERLLASPHYGERWARHWLDVIRYGESQGFERDKLRLSAWRFRDWVVAALNDDMPYDEFVRMQLAGDVLRPADPHAVIATGFLVAAPYDEVGQTQQSLAMRKVVRQDELEDLVGTIGQTFLGLTVNCARCHDHKFDPVAQTDYYKLTAAVGGVRHGERESLEAGAKTAASEQRTKLEAEITRLREQVNKFEGPIRERLLTALRAKPKPATPQPLAAWDFDGDAKDRRGKLDATLHGAARLANGKLILDGKDSYAVTPPVGQPIGTHSLVAWISVSDLKQRGGGAMTLEGTDGSLFDAIVFGERQEGRWMAGSNFFQRTRDVEGPAEKNPDSVQIAIVWQADKNVALYRQGKPYGAPYPAPSLLEFEAGQARILFGLRHSPAGAGKHFHGAIDRAMLFDQALTAEQVFALSEAPIDEVTADQIVAELSPTERAERTLLVRELTRLEAQRGLLSPGKTYAVTPKTPEVTNLLHRGNPGDPRQEVTAGAIQAVSVPAVSFPPGNIASDADRRAALARWITDPANPLTARVLVNRIWHYHFGIGLVDTPNDFGFNGGRPTHPELLDWLASQVVADGWKLKSLQRQIVLSQTYRQAAAENPAAAKIDRDNRLLWRKNPQRLDAESVRDAVLLVSGRLNPSMGGPGFQDFRTSVNNSQFYELIDVSGYPFERRSLYRTWVRSGTNKFLDVFDCPDPSTATPKRAVTTTPLQALALLNNAFMLRMAEHLADRLRREAGKEPVRQLTLAYQLAFARAPTEAELRLGGEFVAAHGLPAYCRVLFNTNEFLYVD